MDGTMEDMASVVTTVSGYHGSEKFNLIKLISQSGASYVGAMSKSITHLVCWKFEGRKYELAKKFDTMVVNHRWVEECVKQGKRVPEYPYMLESGQEVGPSLLEVPNVDKQLGSSNKNRRPLSDKSNICDNPESPKTDVDREDSGMADWSDSFWLNDVTSLVHEAGKSNSGLYKSKLKRAKKSSKQENWSSSKYCSQDPSISWGVRLEEDSSSDSSRHENSYIQFDIHTARRRDIFHDTGSISLAETSRKGRRPVKKNVGRDNLETVLLDSDQECHPSRPHKKSTSAATSKQANCKRKTNINEMERTSDVGVSNNGDPASEDPNSCPEGALANLERVDAYADESLNAEIKDVGAAGQSAFVATLPNRAELSCVICWTEFSSTRGVLPCGHRFCYSCIQDWADHRASKREISTCPLCKACFAVITKVENAASYDQKIYSQTIPCTSSAVNVVGINQGQNEFGTELPSGPVCCECRSREPEDLLINCHLCQFRCIHSYCQDPPLPPWTCTPCKDLHMRYRLSL